MTRGATRFLALEFTGPVYSSLMNFGERRAQAKVVSFQPDVAGWSAVYWAEVEGKIKARFEPVVGWATVKFIERSGDGSRLEGSDEDNACVEIVACVVADEGSEAYLVAADFPVGFIGLAKKDDASDWDAVAQEVYAAWREVRANRRQEAARAATTDQTLIEAGIVPPPRPN